MRLRDTILDVATELLIETGYAEAVSIRSVAERAGVTSPSIYLHFASKDALLDAVCARYLQQLDEEMQSAAAACATPVGILNALGITYIRFALKNPAVYRIATMCERRAPTDVDTVLAGPVLGHLRDVVERMIAEGIYPPRREANETAFELWAVVHGVAALFIAKPYWPLDDVEALANRVLRAMCVGQIAAGGLKCDTLASNAIDQFIRLESLD